MGPILIKDMRLQDVLSLALFGQQGRAIVNRTAFTGRYDLVLQSLPAPRPGNSREVFIDYCDNRATAVQASMRKNYGIELLPGHGPAEVLVVDAFTLPKPD